MTQIEACVICRMYLPGRRGRIAAAVIAAPTRPATEVSSGGHVALHIELTRAERELLHLLCRGHRPQQIARLRTVEVTTVRSQLRRLYERTEAHGLLELALWAHTHLDCCIGPLPPSIAGLVCT
jgi:DNA-binding CsgD family transcriptional regulator